MSEQFSVKAILSADASNFNSVFGGAVSTLSRFDSLTGGLTGGLSGIANMVKGGLGFGIMQGIGQKAFSVVADGVSKLTSNLGGAVSRYDTLKKFPDVMGALGLSAEDAGKLINDKLVPGINDLPTTLDSIVANTQSVALVTRDLDKSTDLVLALNNAFLGSGASSEAAERGMTQFVQALSKGKFQGDEWITLMETMGPALYKVANYMGFDGTNAANDLKEALGNGSITVDEFTQAIIDMNGEVEIGGEKFEGFEAMARASTGGIETEITNLKTTVVKQLEKMISAFDDSGLSIAEGIHGIKEKMNDLGNWFRKSDLFKHLIDSTKSTIEAIKGAVDTFTNSPAMQAVYESIDTIVVNLGTILPNIIKALEPIIEAIATVAAKVFAAISNVIKEVTSNPAFMTFCENIGKAIQRVGDLVTSVINHLAPYFTAILNAANEVMEAFGKAFDAIVNSARQTDTAGKLYSNFEKVLGFVKTALIKVAEFLEKHHTWILKIIEHLPQIITLIFAVKTALAVLEKVQAFKALIDQVADFGKEIKRTVGDVKTNIGKIIDHFKSIFGAAKDAGTGYTNFASVTKGALSNVDTYMGNTGTASYTLGQNVTSLSGSFTTVEGAAGSATKTICNNLGGVVEAAKNTGSGIESGVGGGFKNAVTSALGTVGTFAGIGVAIGTAIFGIVNAIKKWREEQYKAGQEAAELSEEQKKVIEKNNELVESYESLRESTKKNIEDHEAESAYANALRDEYTKLIDTNGEVIEGKEKQAEAIQAKLFEAIGLEYSTIKDLQTEYKNLLDGNGNVISGYEDRAAEIRGNLSDALGKEITDTQAVMDIDNSLIGTIDDLIEKKRLEAEASVLSDAWVESEKKKKELYDEQLEMVDMLREEQGKYYDFLQSKGVEHEEDLKHLSSEEQGRFDKIKENISDIESDLDRNARAQERCETDKQIAMDATVANMEGNHGKMSILLAQYDGELVSAKDAVRDYGDTAMQKLNEQAENAEINYQKIKTAYENGEVGASETALREAEARRVFAKEQLDAMYNDTSIHYESVLREQLKSAQEELTNAQEHYKHLSGLQERELARESDNDIVAARQRLENAEANYRESETAYSNYMNNLNTEGSEKLGQLTQTTDVKTKEMSNVATANANTMTSGVVGAISPLDPMVTSIVGNAMTNSNNALITGGNAMAGSAGTAVNAVTGAVSTIKTSIPADVSTAFSGGKQAILNKTGELGSAAGTVTDKITGELGKTQNVLPSTMNNALTSTGNVIRASGVAQEIVTIRDRMAGYMDYLSTQFRISGQNAMTGLQSGINARAGNVYNTAQVIATNIANIINAALQIHSPSRVMAFTGRMIDAGLIEGMNDYKSRVGRVAEGIAQTTAESFDKVNNMIAFPDITDMSRRIPNIATNANMQLNSEYDYSHNAHLVSEIHLEMDKREISRVTVDTDSEEQYYNQKRFYR